MTQNYLFRLPKYDNLFLLQFTIVVFIQPFTDIEEFMLSFKIVIKRNTFEKAEF